MITAAIIVFAVLLLAWLIAPGDAAPPIEEPASVGPADSLAEAA